VVEDDAVQLPHWKKFLTVLFGLYPTVALLSMILAPHTQRFGPAVAILIGNVASVSFLEWLGMPVISRVLGPWLRANGKESRVRSGIGLLLIVGALGLMTFLFSLVMV
jgi:antibiotic biosynthesis monooxygenase (ABM) superfamily enzyme